MLLLIANFLFALTYTASAIDVATRLEVHLRNGSGIALTDISLAYPGGPKRMPDLEPGETVARALRVGGDGMLVLHIRARDGEHQVVVSDYVTGGLGEYFVITVGPDFTATVDDERPPVSWPLLP